MQTEYGAVPPPIRIFITTGAAEDPDTAAVPEKSIMTGVAVSAVLREGNAFV